MKNNSLNIFIHIVTFGIVFFVASLYPIDSSKNLFEEVGTPYLKNFTENDHHGGAQNWEVAQSENGIIYIGNNLGILEYDGVSWRIIKTPSTVRSLAIDTDGKIFFGAQGEFGYLETDSAGRLQSQSLLEQVPEEFKKFSDVWQTIAIGRKVYFRTAEYIFRWNNGRIRAWKPQTRFHVAFSVRDKFYVRQHDVGLMQMTEDSLQLIAGGELFSKNRVYTLLPYSNKKTLIGTDAKGLFIFDGRSIIPFPTQADPYLIKNRIYCGTVLRNEEFALGTRLGGVVILDKNGNLVQIISEACGMQGNFVHSILPDYQEGLWIALNNGVSLLEARSPFSYFNEISGIQGTVINILRHQGIMYAATSRGLYYLDAVELPSKDVKHSQFEVEWAPKFKPIAGIDKDVFCLLSMNGNLLATSGAGVFKILNKKAIRIRTKWSEVITLHRSLQDTNRLYVGLRNGIAILQLDKGKFIDYGIITGVSEGVFSIVEGYQGSVWLGTNFQGVLQLKSLKMTEAPSEEKKWTVEISRFGSEHGLPGDGYVKVIKLNGKVVFATNKALRYFDPQRQAFLPDSIFGPVYADTTRWVLDAAMDHQRKIWIRSEAIPNTEISIAVPQQGGTYRQEYIPFLRMFDFGSVYTIFPDQNDVIWFGGPNGILRYDPSISKNYSLNYRALIRRVAVMPGDSLLFYGYSPRELGQKGLFPKPILAHRNNAIRFEFAAPFYEQTVRTQFQTLLEDFDNNWSPWSQETKKDYTNLPEGNYRFRVRAKNIYEYISDEAVFDLTVLPPWYRTWLAYTFYGLIFALFLIGFAKILGNRLKRKAEEQLQKERERAMLKEAQLRAETLEAQKEIEKHQIRNQIAADLHDEIGSNLSSIALISESLQDHSEFHEEISDIYHAAQESGEALGDIVWLINPEQDQVRDLIARFKETAGVLLRNIPYEFKNPDLQFREKINPEIKRNIYLMYKEILNNIIKHSGAKQVEIDVEKKQNKLQIQVKDDGVGFDEEKVKDGNGLRNLHNRSEQIESDLIIRSSPGSGTTIIISVNIT